MHVQALFALLDSDGDGQLTPADFGPVEALNPGTGYALWEELRRDFEPADPSVITPVEFIAKVKSVALAHALSKASFERVPATNLACLHALNTSINAVIIELCKTLHGRVAALSAAGAAGPAVQLVLLPPHALWREPGLSELPEAMLYIEEEPNG